MSEEEKQEAQPEGKRLKLIAGVFLDPETGLMEIQPGAEGINPYAVLAGALYQFASDVAQMAKGVFPQNAEDKPKVLRARGPLPKGMKRL